MQRLEFEVLQIDGLWEAMQIQILKVREIDRNPWPVVTTYILYRNGVLEPLPLSSQSSSLTSATVVGNQLYFSYAEALPASGLPTNTFVRLTVEEDRNHYLYVEGPPPPNLFLVTVDGCVQVQSGDFQAFNSWNESVTVGWLKAETSGLVQAEKLTIVDEYGFDVCSTLGTPFDWINTPHRWIVLPESNHVDLGNRFAIKSPRLFGLVQSRQFPAVCGPIDVADRSVEFSTRVDPPVVEPKPQDHWIDLSGDEEDQFATLFSIRE